MKLPKETALLPLLQVKNEKGYYMKKIIICILTMILMCSCNNDNNSEQVSTIVETTTVTAITTTFKSADKQLEEIKKQYDKENWQNVIRLVEKLQSEHPDSEEAIEAETLLKDARIGLKKYKSKYEAEKTTTTVYEWKLNTSSDGYDWYNADDVEKDVWCSNSFASWRLMGYDIPSSASQSVLKSYLDEFYKDTSNRSVDLVTATEVYAELKGIY